MDAAAQDTGLPTTGAEGGGADSVQHRARQAIDHDEAAGLPRHRPQQRSQAGLIGYVADLQQHRQRAGALAQRLRDATRQRGVQVQVAFGRDDVRAGQVGFHHLRARFAGHRGQATEVGHDGRGRVAGCRAGNHRHHQYLARPQLAPGLRHVGHPDGRIARRHAEGHGAGPVGQGARVGPGTRVHGAGCFAQRCGIGRIHEQPVGHGVADPVAAAHRLVGQDVITAARIEIDPPRVQQQAGSDAQTRCDLQAKEALAGGGRHCGHRPGPGRAVFVVPGVTAVGAVSAQPGQGGRACRGVHRGASCSGSASAGMPAQSGIAALANPGISSDASAICPSRMRSRTAPWLSS